VDVASIVRLAETLDMTKKQGRNEASNISKTGGLYFAEHNRSHQPVAIPAIEEVMNGMKPSV